LPEDIAEEFDRFANSFYDSNVRALADLSTIERLLRESVIDLPETLRAAENLQSLSAAFAEASRTGAFHELPLDRLQVIANASSRGALLGDERLLDVLPAELVANLPDLRSSFDKVVRAADVQQCLCAIRSALASGDAPSEVTFNEAFVRARERDSRALNVLADFELAIEFDFASILDAVRSVSQIARRAERLRGYLARKGWLARNRIVLRFDPSDFGPFFSLRRIVSSLERMDPANSALMMRAPVALSVLDRGLEEIAAKYGDLVEAVSRVVGALSPEVTKALRERCEETVSFGDGNRFVVRTPSPGGSRVAMDQLLEAHGCVSRRIVLPAEVQPMLLDVTDTVRGEDVDLAAVQRVLEGNWNLTEQTSPSPVPAQGTKRSLTFLSYAKADVECAARLSKLLGERGVQLWFDEVDVKAGQLFQDCMMQGLKEAQAVIVLIGRAGLAGFRSLEAKVAIAQHLTRGIPVLPVLLPGVDKLPDNVAALALGQFSLVQFKNSVDEIPVLDRIVAALTVS
jgi:hypothetical protein